MMDEDEVSDRNWDEVVIDMSPHVLPWTLLEKYQLGDRFRRGAARKTGGGGG